MFISFHTTHLLAMSRVMAFRPCQTGESSCVYICIYYTVEPGYSEVHKSGQSFHYSHYFTIARFDCIFLIGPIGQWVGMHAQPNNSMEGAVILVQRCDFTKSEDFDLLEVGDSG